MIRDDYYKVERMSKMIGIIGAMEEEVSAKEEMQTEEIKEIAGMTFVKGVLCGRNVVVVRSGIGKVNAAVAPRYWPPSSAWTR